MFQGQLSYPMIVVTRDKSVFGHYSYNRWTDATSSHNVDEIAINPLWFSEFPLIEICQTLCHEMCHQWQYHYGSPSRTGYHNKEWADKMVEIGLMPSSTGMVGGKIVGQKMADYPISDGRFYIITQSLIKEKVFSKLYFEANSNINRAFGVDGHSTFSNEIALTNNKNKKKIKYSCVTCNINVWGKPDLNLICGECKSTFEQQTPNIV